MKRAALALAIVSLLLFYFWNREPAPAPAGMAATPEAAADAVSPTLPPPPLLPLPADAVAATAGLQRVRGRGVMGKDGYGITPCGETSQRIADFGPDAAKVLDTFLASGAREFFIDAWAGPGTGNHLAVSRIERIYSDGPSCDEALGGIVFAARGNEPFWSVRAGQDGVVLERPGVDPVTGPFNGVTEADGGKRIESDTPLGKLVVQFMRAPCSDGMSDSIYGWTAKASLRNEAWAGCGFSGLSADRD